jgi:protein gp37
MSRKSRMTGKRKTGLACMNVSAGCLLCPAMVTPLSRLCHYHTLSYRVGYVRIADPNRLGVSMVARSRPRQWLVPLMWEAEK